MRLVRIINVFSQYGSHNYGRTRVPDIEKHRPNTETRVYV